MNTYFIKATQSLDSPSAGPFPPESFVGKLLDPDDLVLKNGDISWKRASEFKELHPYIKGFSISTKEIIEKENLKEKKIKIPSIILLIAFCAMGILITYFIASIQRQNDLNEINKKIDAIFKDKSIITDYSYDGTDGKLYDVDLLPLNNTIETHNVILAYKPASGSYVDTNNASYQSQLEQWNTCKEFIQYYESIPFSGFEVLRLEKNSTSYTITESWSGDMAYTAPETKHYDGYSNDYYSSPGYDIPTYRPSVYQCYKNAAEFLTSGRSDSSYEAGGYNKISSFDEIQTGFYEISQLYPKYHRYPNRIHVEINLDDTGNVTDNSFQWTDATSYGDVAISNSQYRVWYKSMTNTYAIEEKSGIFYKYWGIYSVIFITLITLCFFGLKYRKRITFK